MTTVLCAIIGAAVGSVVWLFVPSGQNAGKSDGIMNSRAMTFDLRTLLVLVAVAAICMAVMAKSVAKSRRNYKPELFLQYHGQLTSVAASGKGLIAVGYENGIIEVLDETDTLIIDCQNSAPIRALRFSPDGSSIICIDRGGREFTLDSSTMSELSSYANSIASPLQDAAFSLDGRVAAFVPTTNDRITVIDRETLLVVLDKPVSVMGPITDIALNADGTKVAFATRFDITVVNLVSFEEQRIHLTPYGPTSRYTIACSVCFGPGDNSMIIATQDGIWRGWLNTNKGKLVHLTDVAKGRAVASELSPDSDILTIGYNDGIAVRTYLDYLENF